MENHFIKNVEFENFKCFEKLKVKELKRVNLIGGKNNIGKTSFMEGLEMIAKPKSAFGLRIVSSEILRRRQTKKIINQNQVVFQEFNLDFFLEQNIEINLKSNVNISNVQVFDVSGRMIKNAVGNNTKEIRINTVGLNKGVYILKITTAKGIITKKVII